MRAKSFPRGFTLVELLVVIAIIGVLVGLLLPATRGAREAARRMSCSNNFKSIGLGLHNYHSAYKHLPTAMGGTGGTASPLHSNAYRLSGMVAVLPFIEQQVLWEQISNPLKVGSYVYPPMGPAPWVSSYDPWGTDVPLLRCPSDPGTSQDFGLTNYAFCIGDMAREIHQPQHQRGMFACGKTLAFREVLDGLASTMAMSEIATACDLSVTGQYAIEQPISILDDPATVLDLRDSERPNYYDINVAVGNPGRGGRWADGSAGFGLVNTILPPNSPSCAIEGSEAVDGLYSTGSHHQGGNHVLMGDGAVIFVTDSIEAGDQHHPTPTSQQLAEDEIESPYGLWGALGTAAAEEAIGDELNN